MNTRKSQKSKSKQQKQTTPLTPFPVDLIEFDN